MEPAEPAVAEPILNAAGPAQENAGHVEVAIESIHQ